MVNLAWIRTDTVKIKITRDIEKEVLECRRQEKNIMLFGPYKRATLEGKEEKTYLEKINNSLITLRKLAEEGKKIAAAEEEKEFNSILVEIENYKTSLKKIITDYDKGKKEADAHILTMRKNARRLEEIARRIMGIAEARIDTAKRKARDVVWPTLIIALVFGCMVSVLLTRNITMPIRKLTTATTLIAKGDLSQRVDIKSTDEIGDLAVSFNKMASDIQNYKEKIQSQNEELNVSNEKIESYSKGLENRVKERTMELSVLYEVSNAISYTLDYKTLLKLIMESLFKIVDYDICASLLFDAHTANITLKPAYTESLGFVNELKNSLIDSTSMLTGENIRNKSMSVFLIPTSPDAKPKEERKFEGIRSFFNVPFIVCGKTIGMINVSSCKDNAFSEENIKLIYTIANQASNAIERLQSVISAEKSKMESMVESMAEGVIMLDEKGQIVVLNPQARQMLGFGPDSEVTSQALDEKMRNIGLDKVLQECQDEKIIVKKEIIIPKGVEEVILHSEVSPVKGIEEEIIGIVTILRDITKEKEIDKMKTEFISTVSHELRTPLSTMKAYASIISDEIPGKLTNDQREYIAIIEINIDRLARLINNLLDISKIEAGRAELKKTLVDITNLAKVTVSALKPEADGKHIEFKTSFPAIAMNAYVDTDKITQVFVNLISNAIKFTWDKGKITVEIKDEEKEIECSVTDTGVGIAQENLRKLFTKFQQFSRTAGNGAKGTGLGLAISKKLIDIHNGRIWAESKIGEGSKFIFTLPKYTAESLIKESVDNGIKQAMKNDSKMSLIVVSLANLDKLRQKLTSEVIDSVLIDMEDILRNSLRREEGDVAIKGTDEVVVILAECYKENALRVEGRIKHILEDYLERKKMAEKIELRFGCATYPDDARNKEELIKKAKNSQGGGKNG